MQIKSIRYHFTASRMSAIKGTETGVGEDGRTRGLMHGCWKCKWCVHFENSLAVPQKRGVTLWPSRSTPREVPESIENIRAHNCHVKVHRNNHNSRRVGRAQMSISWWTDRMRCSRSAGYYLAITRNEVLMCGVAQHGGPGKHRAHWKKPDTKPTYCMIPSLWRFKLGRSTETS